MGESITYSHDVQTISILYPQSWRSAVPSSEAGCIWQGGSYGQQLTCPQGSAVRGICGSGTHADCNGQFHEIYCCPLAPPSGKCYWYGGKPVKMEYCHDGEIVYGTCGAGHYADCSSTGKDSYFDIECCQPSGVTIGSDRSNWSLLKAKYGQRITCATHYVMVAGCGSGKNGDCTGISVEMTDELASAVEEDPTVLGGDTWTSMYCAPYQ